MALLALDTSLGLREVTQPTSKPELFCHSVVKASIAARASPILSVQTKPGLVMSRDRGNKWPGSFSSCSSGTGVGDSCLATVLIHLWDHPPSH